MQQKPARCIRAGFSCLHLVNNNYNICQNNQYPFRFFKIHVQGAENVKAGRKPVTAGKKCAKIKITVVVGEKQLHFVESKRSCAVWQEAM
jgi:hypothetical protein